MEKIQWTYFKYCVYSIGYGFFCVARFLRWSIFVLPNFCWLIFLVFAKFCVGQVLLANFLSWPFFVLANLNFVYFGNVGGRLGYRVCVLDAAVLLKAKWDTFMHEVWVSIIPPEVSVQRVKERDGVSDEIAHMMLEAQSSSAEAVRYGHVVFCSLWEPEYTQKQVTREREREREYIYGYFRFPCCSLSGAKGLD